MLARYAVFCSGCALIQLAHLTGSTPQRHLRDSHQPVRIPRGGGAIEVISPRSAGRSRAWAPRLQVFAAVLSLAVEALIGFVLFRWWVVLVVAGGVTVCVDLAALGLRPRTALVLGAVLCLAGAYAMLR